MLGNRLRSRNEVDHPVLVWQVSTGHGVNEFFSVVIPPIIPLLVTDLGISYTQAGLLMTVFFAMYSVFQLPAGVISASVGKFRLMVLGILGMAGAFVLAATAETYGVLIAAQLFAGISGSTFHPTGLSIISDVESGSTEGTAMGIFGFGGVAGTIMAPVVVGGLTPIVGWRLALGSAALAGLLVGIALWVSFGRSATETGVVHEDVGTHSGSMLEYLQSLRPASKRLRSKRVALLICITFLVSMQGRAVQTFTTSYIADDLDGSVLVGNVGFFALMVGAGLSTLWAGRVADRYNREYIGIIFAMLTGITVAGTLLISILVGGTAYAIAVFIGLFFVIGLVIYIVVPVKNALISNVADAKVSGGLFGITQTASAGGSATGPAVFGWLASNWGIGLAFPVIALVSLALTVSFGLLALDSRGWFHRA